MGINSPLIRPHLPRQQGAGQDARHLGGAHLPPIQGREKGARATPCLTRGRRKGAQQSAGHPAWLAALCEASELGVMPAFPSLEHASCVVLWADLMTPPPPPHTRWDRWRGPRRRRSRSSSRQTSQKNRPAFDVRSVDTKILIFHAAFVVHASLPRPPYMVPR